MVSFWKNKTCLKNWYGVILVSKQVINCGLMAWVRILFQSWVGSSSG